MAVFQSFLQTWQLLKVPLRLETRRIANFAGPKSPMDKLIQVQELFHPGSETREITLKPPPLQRDEMHWEQRTYPADRRGHRADCRSSCGGEFAESEPGNSPARLRGTSHESAHWSAIPVRLPPWIGQAEPVKQYGAAHRSQATRPRSRPRKHEDNQSPAGSRHSWPRKRHRQVQRRTDDIY